MPTRILLVEDNPGDAVIFREKLLASDLEFDLVHATRLQQGLDLVQKQAFDILLVDLSLPDAQGLDTVRQVREVAPQRPLIVLTGLDDATMAAEAKKEGAVDYLVKWYVDSPSLARYIRYAIAQYRMFGDSFSSTAAVEEAERARGSEGGAAEAGSGSTGEGGAERSRKAEGPAARSGAREADPPARAVPAKQGRGDTLRGALDEAGHGVVIVDQAGAICFANAAAVDLLAHHAEPGARYPWPIERGVRPVSTFEGTFAQHVTTTRWNQAEAHFVTLIPAPAPETEGADDHLGSLAAAAEAALRYVERVEQRSAWMADALRSALDGYRQDLAGVALQPEAVDLYDLAQQAVRKHRPIALRRGVALRATSDRKKVIAHVDRNAAMALLHRLVTDAAWATTEGAVVRVDVVDGDAVIEVVWEAGDRPPTATSTSISDLGVAVVERQAGRVGAAFAHERRPGGGHTVRLTFSDPIPEAVDTGGGSLQRAG